MYCCRNVTLFLLTLFIDYDINIFYFRILAQQEAETENQMWDEKDLCKNGVRW